MSEWISLDKLLKKRGIIKKNDTLDFIDEFSDFLKEGLQPYSKSGKPIPCLKEVYEAYVNAELIEELEEQIRKAYWVDWDPLADEFSDSLTEADRKLKYQIKKLHERNEIINKDDSDHTSWKYLSLPRHHELGCLDKRDLVFQTIRYSFFKKDNVAEIESKLLILTAPEEIKKSDIKDDRNLRPNQKHRIKKKLKDSIDTKQEDTHDLNKKEINVSHAKEAQKGVRKKGPLVKFPTPPGTKWEDVIIQIVSKDSVKITALQIHRKYTYAEMGFKDMRKGDLPDKQWETLLNIAAENGKISWNSQYSRPKIQKRIQTIRKRLKDFMGIDDDPFNSYRKYNAYKTKFKIEDTIYSRNQNGSSQ